MGNGSKLEFDSLMATDILTFFTIYDIFVDNKKKENAKMRAKQQGSK
jgi:hypothetical protein